MGNVTAALADPLLKRPDVFFFTMGGRGGFGEVMSIHFLFWVTACEVRRVVIVARSQQRVICVDM